MATNFFGVARSFHFSHVIGRSDYVGASFRAPMDVGIGQDDVLYVVNRARENRKDGVRVTVCTIGEDYLMQFGSYGEEDGQFMWPTSIALDRGENVYISDQWLNRISIFDKGGNFLDRWGTKGAGEGQINEPFGITFDSEDNLHVVDSGNNRVQKFTKDGKFLGKWGEGGRGPGQFNLPWGIAIDHNGDVYVADWRNNRVQKFTAQGEFLAEFGSSGSGVAEFNRPTGVAIDKHGDIYVADWGNNRVEVLTPDGRHIATFTGDAGLSKWGKPKLESNPDMVRQRSLVMDFEPEKRLWNPVSIEIDPQGRILVLEAARHRIQVYQKENY